MPASDTIAAIATPPGIGGIGIVRISGPLALEIGNTLTDAKLQNNRVRFKKFLDASGQTLDHGLCFYCQAPHSFSGEDIVEIQGHGGPVLLDMLLERVCQLGARLARAGEFSERAFLNGKVDLAQAEAIADLIESGSRTAAKAAMRSLEGQFSKQVHQLVDDITNLRAYIEAALDFAEEEIDFLADSPINDRLQHCRISLENILKQAEHGRLLNEGLALTLAGLPNAGKSSLLNYFAGYEAAIVTEVAGTTRDVLREHISLNGIPLHVHDTAGLRESDNLIEKEGIKRAWQEIDKADTVLLLVDATIGLGATHESIIDRLKSSNYHLVYTKSDLLPEDAIKDPEALYISTLSGAGLEALIDVITGNFSNFTQHEQSIMARRRHVEALQNAYHSLMQAQDIFAKTQSGELAAEDLRLAQQYLSEITGEFTSDDLLGRIFSKFCIGK